ncbi:MAG: cobalamin biosynthesis protein [Calditerrivibrio sp.]|nr:cobalamin biosynthesis protein [Calditerrivibrio sp.]MCA1932721.1 cobalamin biosynthesis protein [Calditerrivibrio sp.]
MVLDRKIATIVINENGVDLTLKIFPFFKSVDIFATDDTVKKYDMRVKISRSFNKLNDIFKYVVENKIDTVAFMASGIAVREIFAVSKYTDAAIVLVDNMGRYAISLMSGHEGGANFLAYNVASIIKAEPIVTTFTEVSKKYILGLGCRKGVKSETMAHGIRSFLEENSIEINRIRHISSCSVKIKEKGIWELERLLNIPIYFVPEERIKLPHYRFNETTAKKYFDIPSVAEASALLSSKNGRIAIPKKSFGEYTLALVEEDI